MHLKIKGHRPSSNCGRAAVCGKTSASALWSNNWSKKGEINARSVIDGVRSAQAVPVTNEIVCSSINALAKIGSRQRKTRAPSLLSVWAKIAYCEKNAVKSADSTYWDYRRNCPRESPNSYAVLAITWPKAPLACFTLCCAGVSTSFRRKTVLWCADKLEISCVTPKRNMHREGYQIV